MGSLRMLQLIHVDRVYLKYLQKSLTLGDVDTSNPDTIEELLGQPHSIVRHPSMPKAAFKDLWETVKSGHKWKGFVKNLAKDGSHYWVYATVFPFVSCDGSSGYVSCRRKASASEVAEYEEIYRQMKSEER